MIENDKLEVDENSEEFVSKTQLKNEAKSLQKFARELVEMPPAKVQQLPLNETTLSAINDFVKQSGNIARKRHLAFIGKCLRHDNAQDAKKMIKENSFALRRANQNSEKAIENKSDEEQNKSQLIALLLGADDKQVHLLIDENPSLSRQTLRQLIRNIKNAKTPEKKKQANTKLEVLLVSNGIALGN